jgi:hypothetical protein
LRQGGSCRFEEKQKAQGKLLQKNLFIKRVMQTGTRCLKEKEIKMSNYIPPRKIRLRLKALTEAVTRLP